MNPSRKALLAEKARIQRALVTHGRAIADTKEQLERLNRRLAREYAALAERAAEMLRIEGQLGAPR